MGLQIQEKKITTWRNPFKWRHLQLRQTPILYKTTPITQNIKDLDTKQAQQQNQLMQPSK